MSLAMNRRRFIGLTVGASGLTALAGPVFTQGFSKAERASRALGAEVSVLAYHKEQSVAERAVAAAFGALEEIENVLRLYRPASQICRLNREGVLHNPHKDLVTVLRSALEWSRLTGGAFDPTVQPLWNLHACGKSPGAAELELGERAATR
jgi:thiamine biosynthesis lipoprotein